MGALEDFFIAGIAHVMRGESHLRVPAVPLYTSLPKHPQNADFTQRSFNLINASCWTMRLLAFINFICDVLINYGRDQHHSVFVVSR